jgi:hypothetical protein
MTAQLDVCWPGELSRYSDWQRAGRSGIESRWRRDFQHPSIPALGSTQPPIQWVLGFPLGVKRLGRGVDHPPPSSAEVKERVELYLYFPPWLSWLFLGWTLPLPLTFYNGMHNLKIKSFRKLSRTADINSTGHGLLITASILTPTLQGQSLEAIHLFLSAREALIKSSATKLWLFTSKNFIWKVERKVL